MNLITGARGFLASAIAQRLDNTIAVDIDDCDLTDWNSVAQLPDVDTVYHFAAYNNTSHFYTKPWDVLQNTTLPTLNLLRRYPNAKFIYASSSEIYAGGLDLGIIDIPTAEVNVGIVNGIDNPRWSYAGSKLMGELAVHASHVQHNTPYLILRYHNVYGAQQRAHFIPEFAERAAQGDQTLPGADQTRAFLYIDDAADITVQLANTANNDTINIGNPNESSILDVAKLILKTLNLPQQLVCETAPQGSVARRCANIEKMMQYIGEYDFTPLSTGLEQTLQGYK